jgi:hypothetical protein
MFQRNMPHLSSGLKNKPSKKPEEGGDMFLWNVI